ncbi:MAG: NAD-dependent epimerase/dehydratase family protein [Candidatus Bathyarchaeota archaeon]|nr:MAG: NAD-dependent epimerase/dehydratase family protein [Candidatus Bathyarchaeota archaeon]
MKLHNAEKTCWNCPAAMLKGNVDFRACGQSVESIRDKIESEGLLIECSRRSELGLFEPSITFEECLEWRPTEYGYLLNEMRVMILGVDGYLGWTLALKLGSLGCRVSGVDCFIRRNAVDEKGSHSVVPIAPIEERIGAAREVLGIDIEFREIDILDREKLGAFMREVEPEAVVHYGEIPSAPYSMVDCDHAIKVQHNNVIGTLGVLFLMKEIVPEASLIKLGTMGEYGAPLTGRPIFEGMFPADAVLLWNDREWSLGGELTPRDPVSFYHVSKVQDTFNVYEACKYWWLRSYDVMQGVIYGVHTEQVASDPRLRTRFDVDEWFGTVVNRFVAQAAMGMPLTIYGEGQQIRGYIALEDAMECMVRLISSPPEPGQYDVVNQVSGLHKVRELAETVAKVASEKFDLKVELQRVENPRVEAANHPFEAVSTKLPNELGFQPDTSLETEIERMLGLLARPEIMERLRMVEHVVRPRTWWSGDKREVETLEIYMPGTKETDGFTPTLVTGKEEATTIRPKTNADVSTPLVAVEVEKE